MQLVVMALGGCSSIDIVDILRKGRQRIDAFTVEIDAERATDQTPALFTTIHAHYALEGDLDVARVRRAIRLSLDKYCSVARILEQTAQITYSFSVNGQPYEA
jgi:putative redox protein